MYNYIAAKDQRSAMTQVTATRSELLVRRAEITLAELGRDVLRRKRDQLMEEFRKLADVVVAGSGALERAAFEARRTLAFANAARGPEVVAAAALATRPELPLRAGTTVVMGLRFPDIEYDAVARPRTQRGYSLVASGPHVDRVAESFETVVDTILRLASDELRLRRLVDEIGSTTRRLNALEWVVIPRLDADRAWIQTVLEERERQDLFRLKRFTSRRASRSGATT